MELAMDVATDGDGGVDDLNVGLLDQKLTGLVAQLAYGWLGDGLARAQQLDIAVGRQRSARVLTGMVGVAPIEVAHGEGAAKNDKLNQRRRQRWMRWRAGRGRRRGRGRGRGLVVGDGGLAGFARGRVAAVARACGASACRSRTKGWDRSIHVFGGMSQSPATLPHG